MHTKVIFTKKLRPFGFRVSGMQKKIENQSDVGFMEKKLICLHF